MGAFVRKGADGWSIGAWLTTPSRGVRRAQRGRLPRRPPVVPDLGGAGGRRGRGRRLAVGRMTARVSAPRWDRRPPRSAGFPAYLVGVDDRRVPRARRASWGRGGSATTGRAGSTCRAPRGTCYVALDPLSALRERLGPVLGGVAGGAREPAGGDGRLAAAAAGGARGRRRPGRARRRLRRDPRDRVDGPVCRAAGLGARLRRGGVRGSAATDRASLRGTRSAVALFGDRGRAGLGRRSRSRCRRNRCQGAPPPMPTPRRADLTVVRPPRTRVPRD